MNCIMKECAHPAEKNKPSACAALGECGCAYVLLRSRCPEGYRVLTRLNPTVDALLSAGLIALQDFSEAVATAKATASPAKVKAA